ncbi:MAG: hypothetical protein NTY01_09175, partial [Verrucomicrobia bacterium]|nr:hypothetical protein [Verrucomicrobiota bacterium]
MRLRSGWLRLSLLLLGLILYGAAVWDNTWSRHDEAVFLSWKSQFHQQWVDGQLSLTTFTAPQAGQGRFIPGFHLAQFVEYELFGLDCWKHHLFRLVVMLALCQVFFSVTVRAAGSPGAAWLAGLLFLCYSPSVDIWACLEMGEFYQLALLLPSVWCLVAAMGAPMEKRLFRAGLTLAAGLWILLAFLVKETSLSFLALGGALVIACFIGCGELLSRRNRLLSGVYLGFHVLAALLWPIMKDASGVCSIKSGLYTSHYQPTLATIASTALKYGDMLWNGFQLLALVALGIFVCRLAVWARRRVRPDAYDGWAFVGLCWFAGLVIITLPWQLVNPYYLGPGLPGLCLFIGLMVWRFLAEPTEQTPPTRSWGRLALRWLVVANLVLLPLIAGIRTNNYLIFKHDYSRATFDTIKTLALYAAPSARFFINVPAEHPGFFTEMVMLLTIVCNRPDLQDFYHCNKPGVPDPRAGDYLLTFTREPEGSSRPAAMAVPASFHDRTLNQFGDRIKLVRQIRYDRRLLACYPDAPIFNWVARTGVKLPDQLGMP